MRYDVYRNLHRNTWSLREHSGLVVGHPTEIVLTDVRFYVQPAGRLRVIKERRKNVHAYICGEVGKNIRCTVGYEFIKYNPYKYDKFVDGMGIEVIHADVVCCMRDGKLYGKGIQLEENVRDVG